jgi:hypothetical protein
MARPRLRIPTRAIVRVGLETRHRAEPLLGQAGIRVLAVFGRSGVDHVDHRRRLGQDIAETKHAAVILRAQWVE